MLKRTYTLLFTICLLGVLTTKAQERKFAMPARGFTSWQPATNWEHALLSGNGTMGAMVMGNPHEETIILSHAQLYLPRERSPHLIDQATHLDSIRQLLLQGKYAEAARVPVALRQKQGYHDERDPFIPAFDLKIQGEASNIGQYQRSVNFETGEAIVQWQDDNGSFERKVFVSRAHSVVVVSIRGTGKINCILSFERRPVEWNQWEFVKKHVEGMDARAEEGGWLSYASGFKFKHKDAVHAYEGLGRIIARNGTVQKEGNRMRVSNADEVLVLIRIDPRFDGEPSGLAAMKTSLGAMDKSYASLLDEHIEIHGDLFNRTKFSLYADEKDKRLHSEEILLKARNTVTPALIEKVFDAGRYNIISATGYNPPNLQGIWSGTWTAPWTGGMTNDGNLAVAISMNLPGNMPELMKGYFDYHKRLLNDYWYSAKTLYGTRGIHVPAQATTTGIDTDFGETWCLTFWTGAAGWVASYFWDHYQYTQDTQFLKWHAYPFMREALLFYEDFLIRDKDGKWLFIPSYSPENNPLNSNSQAAVNATMDIMIAKQLLRNVISAAQVLKVDRERIPHLQRMLKDMPEYGISKEGALREWLWKDLQENFSHRHASQLYALYDEVAPEFRENSSLREAAKKLIDAKMKFRSAEGGGEMAFGLVQLGLAAAHLGDSEQSYQLLQWLSSKYWTNGMGSYHNVNGLFNTDISGGLPYLVTQMLTYSEMGKLWLLPALPDAWKKGKIEGLLFRGNIVLKSLEWDKASLFARAVMTSGASQVVQVRLPQSSGKMVVNGKEVKPVKGKDYLEVKMQAGKDVILEWKMPAY